MAYIIHVIEEVSNHIYNEDEFIVEDFVPPNENTSYEVLRGDGFFYSKEEDLGRAISKVANKIQTENENGILMPLSKIIVENYNSEEVREIGLNSLNPEPPSLKCFDDTNSNLTKIGFPIVKKGSERDWIEYHILYFYAIKMTDMVDID